MHEDTAMRGQLTLQLSDRSGLLVARHTYRNRIVLEGRRLVAQMFGGPPDGSALAAISHIGIGTGGDATADGQTGLVAERAGRRPLEKPVYEPAEEGGVQRIRVRLTATFDFDQGNGPEPLLEAALFNAEAGGVMYNRVVFQPVTKTDAFKLTLLWDVLF